MSMKLSLNWIFDHIVEDWHTIDVNVFVEDFNKKVAAIEHCDAFTWSVDHMSLVRVKQVNDTMITVFSPEWQKEIMIPMRSDARAGRWFLIKTLPDGGYSWVTLSDCGDASAHGLLSAVYCPKAQQMGAWKKLVELQDYILDLDNPSITHRPDLWGVRGIARESAALLGFRLRRLSGLLARESVVQLNQTSYKSPTSSFFILQNDAGTACDRFAGMRLNNIATAACALPLAFRLCRTQHRPINLLVDVTNYVMCDLGQPMHAFDAKKIETDALHVRMAQPEEPLTLLDGTSLKLCSQDIVISDSKRALSLAGVMGGQAAAVDESTSSAFIEAANFDSSTIRRTSSRYHVRTHASARFEKGLDANWGVEALLRMLKLLKEVKVRCEVISPLVVLGAQAQPKELTISHEFIEERLGTTIEKQRVKTLLKSIDFGVTLKRNVYHVMVPTFRGPRGITIPEDIVEEVGRLLGWDAIVPVMPQWNMSPKNTRMIMLVRSLKQQFAFGLGMHEVQNYPFYDERFLQSIGWQPTGTVRAKNPLSLNVTQLVSSLIPHLLMNVQQNVHQHDALRFFECNRTWHLKTKIEASEQQICAGITWHVKNEVDFYAGKRDLTWVFDSLGIFVTWHKHDTQIAAWYNPQQSAQLRCGDTVIGYAGMIDRAFVHDQVPGTGFLFELSLPAIYACAYPQKRFVPLAKYPSVYLDVSIFVAADQTVADLEQRIFAADERIYDVELLDMFIKDTWQQRRSLTFRFYMRDLQTTLVKQAIDVINGKVINMLTQAGAEIR
jgi:phenylalanyl-tRNA synthetase beta chain